jgi:hypothetical protein
MIIADPLADGSEIAKCTIDSTNFVIFQKIISKKNVVREPHNRCCRDLNLYLAAITDFPSRINLGDAIGLRMAIQSQLSSFFR